MRLMGWVWTIIGSIIGIMHIVGLIKAGFNVDVYEPFRLVLEDYNRFVAALFSNFEPPLRDLVKHLGAYFNWNLALFPHWRHILVLMFLIIGASVGVAWRAGARQSAISYALSGFVLACVAALGSGTVPLAAGAGNLKSTLLIATIPVASMFVYGLLESAWAATVFPRTREGEFGWRLCPAELRKKPWPVRFLFHFRYDLYRIGFVLLTGALAFSLPPFRRLPNAGLAFLGFLTLSLAMYYVLHGAGKSFANERAVGLTRWQIFLAHENTRVGLAMLFTLISAISVIAWNRGV